jgi:hypothetical protein
MARRPSLRDDLDRRAMEEARALRAGRVEFAVERHKQGWSTETCRAIKDGGAAVTILRLLTDADLLDDEPEAAQRAATALAMIDGHDLEEEPREHGFIYRQSRISGRKRRRDARHPSPFAQRYLQT